MLPSYETSTAFARSEPRFDPLSRRLHHNISQTHHPAMVLYHSSTRRCRPSSSEVLTVRTLFRMIASSLPSEERRYPVCEE